jgi:CRP-like cAMP-binding protein
MMEVMAWLAVMLVFASFFMKTIVPLRALAIASNLIFIVYGLLGIAHGDAVFSKVLPILVLHCALLPVNLMRLREAKSAIGAVRSMQGSHHTADLLAPYMHTVTCAAGKTLYRHGDPAEKVYVLKRGAVRINETGKVVQKDELFGENDIFLERALRASTAICTQDCELLCVSAEKVVELFFHDQRIAFQMARRLAGRQPVSAHAATMLGHAGDEGAEQACAELSKSRPRAANDLADAERYAVPTAAQAHPAMQQSVSACAGD